MTRGSLWLIPSPLTDIKMENLSDVSEVLVTAEALAVRQLKHFILENGKRGRAWLKVLGVSPSQVNLYTQESREGREIESIDDWLKPALEGEDVGLLSDAGCPCVADPGALWVLKAHELGISVRPLVGPSSLLMALMASGLNGQCFGFYGYLPTPENEKKQKINELVDLSKRYKQTIQVIETPYRNESTISALLKYLPSETLLSIAFDLKGEGELIKTQQVSQWRVQSFVWGKKPAVFSFLV
jgi:16S rRNA (cytidine1402-2'-O)-methyltransferase